MGVREGGCRPGPVPCEGPAMRCTGSQRPLGNISSLVVKQHVLHIGIHLPSLTHLAKKKLGDSGNSTETTQCTYARTLWPSNSMLGTLSIPAVYLDACAMTV